MNIAEWLKENDGRVIYRNRWLLYDYLEWVVYERKYGKKITTVICQTPSEEEAVECLMVRE
ncbi:hypothetical protein LCGC14_1507320 [marine sediment metagenome]|uniref:Uncharacterized protein n=1 Tax=marine sediment metagenome TaxID=412755 RepID=A0A0F9M3Q7_9ZZZZ